ncbi:hypothetical protein KAJ87_02565 [Candidatus Pacearchaeota archaeon]|nr:hypothetical protein [Candidatus Pacearchaeota archaeon]
MKRGLTFILCLSLILVLSLSLISAGWFSDFLGKITGKVVEGECIDSDGGENIYVKGTASGYGLLADEIISETDQCQTNGDIAEAVCSENGPGVNFINCPNGCKDGACIKESSGNVTTCTDSDGGKNIYEKGATSGQEWGTGQYGWNEQREKVWIESKQVTVFDYCITEGEKAGRLVEYFCSDKEDLVASETFACPNGCEDGVCLPGKKITEEVTCIFVGSNEIQKCYTAEETSRAYCSGKQDCGTEISGYDGEKITWKSSCGGYGYTVIDGESETVEFNCVPQIVTEVTEEEINSKGFRSAYWGCYDKTEEKQGVETSCKSSDTWRKYAEEFCNGKCDAKGKCGVSAFSVSRECDFDQCSLSELEVKICSYLGVDYEIKRQIGSQFIISYNSVVEDVSLEPLMQMTLKNGVLIQRGVDSINANLEFLSILEEEVEISLTCKDSCPLDGKCYSFGYRKSGKFCSDTGSFIEQTKDNEKCDNNFECSSNVCVNDKCVSGGLIEKIISWLKKFFGGE